MPRRGSDRPVGPQRHRGRRARPGAGVLRECVRWWDRWLKGVENGAEDEPMLVAYLQDRIVPAGRCAVRPGRWVTEQTWPVARRRGAHDPVSPARA